MGLREARPEWMLLIHLLPPKPTSLRVRAWRKLQRLGALPLKNSVYVLPFNEKTHEDFQWLKQEIEGAGGEATVFRAGSVEGATDEEIIDAFRKARDEEYARLAAELDGLTGAAREQKRGGHLSAGRLGGYEAGLDKLHAELERVISTDFFGARGRVAATAAYERCRKALRASQDRRGDGKEAGATKSDVLHLPQYQGRRWVTRRNLHIDRLASAWLIRQFIDRRPRFHFVAEGERVEGGIPFDMFGAEFTHRGDDCTFETLIKRFRLGDDHALGQLAEIVHDIDLKDDKFNRLEAAGVNATVTGLSELLKDDRKLLQQSGVIFDGLYALLSVDAGKDKGEGGGGKKRGRGAGAGGRKKSG
ncbi:MAG: chromate resistance protein [Acidobacteria bacterium]|nr:chromate resistance protein [Acidobacteriota bacterium]MCA1621521.1 chromate resistance protein [Acidobacteriota bacterium]